MSECDFNVQTRTCVRCGWTYTGNQPITSVHRQCPKDAPSVEIAVMKGPGDLLHEMIKRWTGEDIETGCQCRSWIVRMNAWGPAGCREHLDEIVAHMLSEAKKRGWTLAGLPGVTTVAALAVRRACRLVEKEIAKHDR